ncbi:U2 small nuclear ribonucleoprotein auxiliary factor 35 kDa subunit-related protein 1-like isoform X2 [Labrus bergylta]|uniref:U2 small nuclear ribonucleoprotein auxiliary factor 35 kDa subunit-related protein 1-like isoform X2 n=1 Tax=Labrus bergylta TaxID=56723 RepID=UPI003313E70D
MSHEKRFKGIPMSKSMRGLCKEEDYEFLGMSGKMTKEPTEGAEALEDYRRHDKEERIRWRQEREQKEKERLQEIEESKKEFQRKVLVEESGMEGVSATVTANQLLTRM